MFANVQKEIRKRRIDARSSSYIASLCNFVLRVVKGQRETMLKCLLEREAQRKGLHVYLSSSRKAHASLEQRRPGRSSIPCSNLFNESGRQNLRFGRRFNTISKLVNATIVTNN